MQQKTKHTKHTKQIKQSEHMTANLKYTWDITVERDFSKKELKLVNLVSTTISHGGDVQELKRAVKQLNFDK
jgi:hypothetical protein